METLYHQPRERAFPCQPWVLLGMEYGKRQVRKHSSAVQPIADYAKRCAHRLQGTAFAVEQYNVTRARRGWVTRNNRARQCGGLFHRNHSSLFKSVTLPANQCKRRPWLEHPDCPRIRKECPLLGKRTTRQIPHNPTVHDDWRCSSELWLRVDTFP
jgi:hypothetical protein